MVSENLKSQAGFKLLAKLCTEMKSTYSDISARDFQNPHDQKIALKELFLG